MIFQLNIIRITVCVPKVPFRFLDKPKYEIRNKDLIFVSIPKLRHKTFGFLTVKITEY